MSYSKVLSGALIDRENDVQLVMALLIEKFGAVRQAHDHLRNLAWLGGKIWWVTTSTDHNGLDICPGKACNKFEILQQISDLHAGLLVFRQLDDNLNFIYLVDQVDKLTNHYAVNPVLDWGSLEQVALLTDTGIMIGGELIGFRKLRQAYNFAITDPHINQT